MPIATETRPRPAHEASRNAQQTWIQLVETTFDTLGPLTQLRQQATRNLFELSLGGTEEALRLCAEVAGSAIEGLRAVPGPWVFASAPLGAWRWILGWSAGVFSGYADSVRKTAAPGTERIKEVVVPIADQAKEIDLRKPGVRDELVIDLTEAPTEMTT